MSVREVTWLIEGYYESQKDHYETINSAIKIAGASVLSGKDMKLFESNDTTMDEKMSYEERNEDLDYLADKFGEF